MAYPPEQKTHYTFEEYTHLDQQGEVRSDYYYGEIFAMAGATRNHNLITVNLAALLRPQGRGEVGVPHRGRIGSYRGAAATGALPANGGHLRRGQSRTVTACLEYVIRV